MSQFPPSLSRGVRAAPWVIGVVLAMILSSCTPQSTTPIAPTQTVVPTLQLGPTRTSTPTPTLQPTNKPALPSPTPTQVPCNLNSPYVGISIRPIYLVNVLDDCTSSVTLGPRGNMYEVDSWLPDGSGFVFMRGSKTDPSYDDVCIWDVAQQAISRCLVEDGINYLGGLWSPGHTNYIAYYRFDDHLDREFVTVAKAESGQVIYETAHSLLENGTAERLLDWHPDGKHILISVANKTKQTAVVVNVETGARQVVATFPGEDKTYLRKGLWVQGGAGVVLGLIDPEYYRSSADTIPEAEELYWVRSDGTGSQLLLGTGTIGRHLLIGLYVEDPKRNRLLLGTYSLGLEPTPMYWLDLQCGSLTKVLGNEAIGGDPFPMGLTPDGRYIVTLNDQLQTHLLNVETGEVKRLTIYVPDPIIWRP